MGSTYVSDPRVWKIFYQNMLDGQFRPIKYRGRQTGGWIGNMYSKKLYMISVNPHLSSKESTEQVVGKHVTPMAAVEERAKVEMKEAIKNTPREDYKISDVTTHRQIQKENTSEAAEEEPGLWTEYFQPLSEKIKLK